MKNYDVLDSLEKMVDYYLAGGEGYILNESYTEILKLDKMLSEANIPHSLERFMDGWQVCYPKSENRIADAIEHCGSYGNTANLLELMGLLTSEELEHDAVVGGLTADEVFKRFKEHYENTVKEKEHDR